MGLQNSNCQIGLALDAKKNVIHIVEGLWWFIVMLFGISNAPVTSWCGSLLTGLKPVCTYGDIYPGNVHAAGGVQPILAVDLTPVPTPHDTQRVFIIDIETGRGCFPRKAYSDERYTPCSWVLIQCERNCITKCEFLAVVNLRRVKFMLWTNHAVWGTGGGRLFSRQGVCLASPVLLFR